MIAPGDWVRLPEDEQRFTGLEVVEVFDVQPFPGTSTLYVHFLVGDRLRGVRIDLVEKVLK